MEPREGRAFAADGHARDARQSAPGSSAESPLLASSSAAASHQHQQQQLAQTPAATLPAIPADPSAREQQAAAKQSLKQWWTKFTKQQQQQQQSGSGPFGKKDDTSPTSSGKGVFGVPLTESLKYAGVAISMVGPDGVNQVYGYIPIVVAKCGLFLKQKATTVEGVFRISGSTRRMKELQDIFDRPPSYGRDVVWGPWSVHDAASVLRRYLNQMPEPVVPYELYDEFRNALPPIDKVKDTAAINASVLRYKALIACLPSSSKYLLCYVLDLLNVFSRHHTQNLMPAANLAVVFQPGLIRPPDVPFHKADGAAGQSSDEALAPPAPLPQLSRTSSNPLASKAMTASSTDDGQAQTTELQRRQDEIKINQEVLEFLINHQDHFVALPEMASSSEVSPVSPTSGSGQSKKSVAGPSAAQPSPASRRPQTPQQPPQTQQRMQATQTSPIAQPPAQRTDNARPTQASQQRETTVRSAVQPQSQSPAQGQAASHQSQSQARQPPMTVKNPTSPPILAPTPVKQLQPLPPPNQPQQASFQKPYRDTQARPASPGRFRGQEAHGITSPSSPLQQTQVLPASQTSAPPAQGPGRDSPVLVLSQQQGPTRTSKSSKDTKDLEKQKDNRKPRKLKKGRTPTGSGANTPLSPPPVMWESSQGLPPVQYPHPTSPYHTSSTPPAHVYDEDTPLSQGLPTGPGVKRSRTLPSPGEKGSAVRRVSGRRGSDSRAVPPPAAAEGRLGVGGRSTAAPSPVRSPLPRGTPSPMLSPRYVGTTAADLEAEQSDSSDAQTGPSDRRKGAGWRRAFKKEKEREQTLQVPTSTGLQSSLSGASSHSEDTGRKGSMQDSVSIQTRRPSTSSAARTEHSDTHSQGQSQLRAVRNPPLQGHGKEGAGSMSKRDAKKAAEQTPQFSAEAIRDAVTNIGR